GTTLLVHLDALVVVVDGDSQLLLSGLLADYILIQVFLDFQRLRKLVGTAVGVFVTVVLKDRVANGNALVADIGAWVIARRRDQFPYDILTLMAERTPKRVVRSRAFHKSPLPRCPAAAVRNPASVRTFKAPSVYQRGFEQHRHIFAGVWRP